MRIRTRFIGPVLLLAFVTAISTMSGIAETAPPLKINQALASSRVDSDAAGSVCVKSKGGRTKFCLRASGLEAKATYYLVVNDAIVEEFTSSAKGSLTIKSLPESTPNWAGISDLVICDSSMNVVLDAFAAPNDGSIIGGVLMISSLGRSPLDGAYFGVSNIAVAVGTGSIWTNSGPLTQGTISASLGDLLDLRNSLVVSSTNTAVFDLSSSSVTFSGSGAHTNVITGADLGTDTFDSASFSNGTLSLGDSTDVLMFVYTDSTCTNALYVGSLDLTGTNTIATLNAPSEIDCLDGDGSTSNTYLQDQTYPLDSTATTDLASTQ